MIGQAVESYGTSQRSGIPILGVALLLHVVALTGFHLSSQTAAPVAPSQAAAPLAVRWEVAAPAAAPQPVTPPKPAEIKPPEPKPVEKAVEKKIPKPVVKKPIEKTVVKKVTAPSPVHVRKTPPVQQQPQAAASPSSQTKLSAPATTQPVTGSKTTSTTGGQQAAPVQQPRFNVAYLSNPAPEYPRQSQMMEEEGVVKLKVHVSADGKPMSVALYQSSGFKRLDQSALSTVQRWKFVPAKQGNQAIEGWVIVPVAFSLRSE
jgi:protein TonB